ncbi:hypothetical protein DFP73DRAFT_562690 [Morchella snyderi]|nr:hypothetical protein DFP73DRAFT_562690 [Morchella snyderi]
MILVLAIYICGGISILCSSCLCLPGPYCQSTMRAQVQLELPPPPPPARATDYTRRARRGGGWGCYKGSVSLSTHHGQVVHRQRYMYLAV